jgi:hypothetical protein
MAPTSGTNTTFGGRLAIGGTWPQGRQARRLDTRPAITIAFSEMSKSRMARLLAEPAVTRNRNSETPD